MLAIQITEMAAEKPKKFFDFIESKKAKLGEEEVLSVTGSVLRYSPHI